MRSSSKTRRRARPSLSGNRWLRLLLIVPLIAVIALAMLGLASAQKRKSEAPNARAMTMTQNRIMAVPLEVQWTQHGQVVELHGKTSAGAGVMVNGEEVVTVEADGRFSYFLGPVVTRSLSITITAQDAQGGVATRNLSVDMQ